MEKPPYTNRLISEKSPYLQQHAHNPVDWYPWGEEAFLKAKDLDRPIFLSIGYSTCHWCHVMEKESFENVEIAEMMNEAFINIKVDREELPEIDSLYMEFAQAIMPSGGGWPLNIVLTPELEPFFATTYVPPVGGHGFIGFKELISRLKELWKDSEEKEKLIEQADKIVEVFEAQVQEKGQELPTREDIQNAVELLFHMADPIYGGIKGEPKFPMGYHSCFLLSYAKLSGESRALFCVELTLDMMQRGGIYDHLGGGFSRYSIDAKWQIPHFEKMLYDNAIAARAYLEAYLYTKKPFYKEIVEEILEYVLRDLLDPSGGFYSAEDADSEGEEGRYYTWTVDEITSVLEPVAARLILDYYGVIKEGNFEGRNILHIRTRLEEFCEKRKLDFKKTQELLKKAKEQLLKEREKRPRPFKDDKMIVSWNGLMIYTLAMSGRTFKKDLYVCKAREAVDFIKKNMIKEGRLMRRWRDGEAKFACGLDEYAFFIHALLALFEIEGKASDLAFAIEMTRVLENEFKAKEGAFFLSDGKDPHIILRRCEFYDGAEPSGNGVHAENLLRLYQITSDESFLKQAEDVLKASKRHIDHHPAGCCYSLMALQRYLDKHCKTIVIALNEKEEHFDAIKNILFDKYLPHHVIVWRRVDGSIDVGSIEEFIPHLLDQIPINGQTTLYICEKGVCLEPKSSLEEIEKALLAL